MRSELDKDGNIGRAAMKDDAMALAASRLDELTEGTLELYEGTLELYFGQIAASTWKGSADTISAFASLGELTLYVVQVAKGKTTSTPLPREQFPWAWNSTLPTPRHEQIRWRQEGGRWTADPMPAD